MSLPLALLFFALFLNRSLNDLFADKKAQDAQRLDIKKDAKGESGHEVPLYPSPFWMENMAVLSPSDFQVYTQKSNFWSSLRL